MCSDRGVGSTFLGKSFLSDGSLDTQELPTRIGIPFHGSQPGSLHVLTAERAMGRTIIGILSFFPFFFVFESVFSGRRKETHTRAASHKLSVLPPVVIHASLRRGPC